MGHFQIDDVVAAVPSRIAKIFTLRCLSSPIRAIRHPTRWSPNLTSLKSSRHIPCAVTSTSERFTTRQADGTRSVPATNEEMISERLEARQEIAPSVSLGYGKKNP